MIWKSTLSHQSDMNATVAILLISGSSYVIEPHSKWKNGKNLVWFTITEIFYQAILKNVLS